MASVWCSNEAVELVRSYKTEKGEHASFLKQSDEHIDAHVMRVACVGTHVLLGAKLQKLQDPVRYFGLAALSHHLIEDFSPKHAVHSQVTKNAEKGANGTTVIYRRGAVFGIEQRTENIIASRHELATLAAKNNQIQIKVPPYYFKPEECTYEQLGALLYMCDIFDHATLSISGETLQKDRLAIIKDCKSVFADATLVDRVAECYVGGMRKWFGHTRLA